VLRFGIENIIKNFIKKKRFKA